MARQADPTEIEKYRTKLLTNPATLLQNMQRMRELLRERSEQVFIERDLTASDEAINDETREEEFARLDEQILRVGARIDDLDVQITEHEKKYPDAALAAKIGTQGGPQHQPLTLNRQQRRHIQRKVAKTGTSEPVLSEVAGPPEEAPEQGTPTAPDPAAEEPAEE